MDFARRSKRSFASLDVASLPSPAGGSRLASEPLGVLPSLMVAPDDVNDASGVGKTRRMCESEGIGKLFETVFLESVRSDSDSVASASV
jgi:hypothetical protein